MSCDAICDFLKPATTLAFLAIAGVFAVCGSLKGVWEPHRKDKEDKEELKQKRHQILRCISKI